MSDSKKKINTKDNIFYFFIFTLAYTVIMQISGGGNKMVKLITYVLLVFIVQYFINSQLSAKICGEVQYQAVFFNTFLPWILIFGLLVLCLNSFPGWLRPFSNTFGYSAAKFGGIDKVSRAIFKTSTEYDASNTDKTIISNLENIYNNPSQMINEIPLEFYTEKLDDGREISKWDFWERMNEAKLIKDEVYADQTDVLKNKFLSLIRLKDNISFFFWYLLTGILSIVVSENFMLNSVCKKSLEQVEIEYEDYLKNEMKSD